MPKSFVTAGTLLVCLLSAPAQVRVELLLDQKEYLLMEQLPLGVRLINHSGQTVQLPGTNWLAVTVEDRDGFVVKQLGAVPAPQPVTVDSTYMATQWIDIGRSFDFRENNTYQVNVRVRIDQWSEDIYGKPATVKIIKGTRLWEQKFGLPAAPGTPPEMRKYILQQANYLDALQLYARVTDETGQAVYKVVRLAPMLLIGQPEAQIDALSRLHVLNQVGRRSFAHICLDPNGDIVLRNTYQTSGVRPVLKATEAGAIYVKGGERVDSEDDFPPTSTALLNRLAASPAVTPAEPAGTATPASLPAPTGDE